MLDIDTWLNENKDATVDDYLKVLIADEEQWKREHPGIFIDDHLLHYISLLVDVYERKHGKLIDYMGIFEDRDNDLTQESLYIILLDIIASGESFFSGYLKYKKSMYLSHEEAFENDEIGTSQYDKLIRESEELL